MQGALPAAVALYGVFFAAPRRAVGAAATSAGVRENLPAFFPRAAAETGASCLRYENGQPSGNHRAQAFNHTVTGIGEMHVREHAVVGGQKDPPNPLVQ